MSMLFINLNLTQFHNTQSKSFRFSCCPLFSFFWPVHFHLRHYAQKRERIRCSLWQIQEPALPWGGRRARQTPFRVVNLSRMPQIRRLNVAAIFADLIVFVFFFSQPIIGSSFTLL